MNITNLDLAEGYWRTNSDSLDILKCLSEDHCVGGSEHGHSLGKDPLGLHASVLPFKHRLRAVSAEETGLAGALPAARPSWPASLHKLGDGE